MSEIYERRQYLELVEQNQLEHEQELKAQKQNQYLKCCTCFCKSILVCLITIIVIIILVVIILLIIYGPAIYEGYMAVKAAEEVYVNVSSDHPDYVKAAKEILPLVFS